MLLAIVSKPESSNGKAGAANAEAKDVLEGSTAATGDESTYVGATHWAAVLENVRELKFSLDGTEAGGLAPPTTAAGTSIFHIGGSEDLHFIISTYLPARAIVDRLLSVYLNSRYAILPSIHCPSFQRAYERFLQDAKYVPIMWIAQLFAVLFISNALSIQKGIVPVSVADMADTSQKFLRGCVKCLELGDYTKPQPFVVEAFLIYNQCLFWSTPDPSKQIWLSFGMLVRLAVRMGYHRDPDQLPNLTPFQGEMRRRVWLILRQFDLLGAWQHGLPYLIRPEWSSTRQPRNLLDTDFDENTLAPTQRPDTFLTIVLWEIAKDELYKVAAKVLDEQLSPMRTTPERVKQLDHELRKAHDIIPTVLKCKPMSRSLADPADLIMMRIKIETLYHKSLCVLHRNHATTGETAVWSRRICATAAMSLLENLNDLFEECKPGGQLSAERWMLGSIHLSDFFLGATVLCWIQSSEQQAHTADALPQDQFLRMNCLLLQSYQYCIQPQICSREAQQVATALRIILSKLGLLSESNGTEISSSVASSEQSSDTYAILNPGHASPYATVEAEQASTDLPIDSLFASNQDIDWAAFDQYFSNPADDMLFDPDMMSLDDMSLP